MSKIIDNFNELVDNRVWVTKKTRMESEARMNKNYFLSIILVNYYTFIVLAFSIWSIIEKDIEKSHYVGIITVIASVGLFGGAIFFSLVGFREKALQYRDSHLKLDKLESNIKYTIRKGSSFTEEVLIEKLHEYEQTYNEIISLTENHSQTDYKKLLISRNLHKEKNISKVKYYIEYYFKNVAISLLFIIPIFLVLGFFYL